MSNSIIRFFTGEVEPARRQKQSETVILARQYQGQAELTGFQMELDKALTRTAINDIVEVDDFRRRVANGDPDLDALIRPIQEAYTQRVARRLGRDF